MPVAAAIHLVDDRRLEIPPAQKIGVQGMHHAAGHGARGGVEGLTEHLAAEHLGTADVAAFAAKQIDLKRLQLKQRQQFSDSLVHAGVAVLQTCG